MKPRVTTPVISLKRTIVALLFALSIAAPAVHSAVRMADIGVCRGCHVMAEVDWNPK